MLRAEVIPWIERATVPFYYLQKDSRKNEYGIAGKDRSGVLLHIGNDHFILTAAHYLDAYIRDDIFIFMSWDDEEKCPIPITTDEIALTDQKTFDITAIKLLPETAAKLLKSHTPLYLADIGRDCHNSRGYYLILGYPRLGTKFVEQRWNDPHPHKPEVESLKYLCKRSADEWHHPDLQYSPTMHLVVGMSPTGSIPTNGVVEDRLDYEGINGISGCGIWLVADRRKNKPLSSYGVEDCKLVAIEHTYDEAAGRVAGTWIDLALDVIAKNFPETKLYINIIY